MTISPKGIARPRMIAKFGLFELELSSGRVPPFIEMEELWTVIPAMVLPWLNPDESESYSLVIESPLLFNGILMLPLTMTDPFRILLIVTDVVEGTFPRFLSPFKKFW